MSKLKQTDPLEYNVWKATHNFR